jgi:hypothetical protein
MGVVERAAPPRPRFHSAMIQRIYSDELLRDSQLAQLPAAECATSLILLVRSVIRCG